MALHDPDGSGSDLHNEINASVGCRQGVHPIVRHFAHMTQNWGYVSYLKLYLMVGGCLQVSGLKASDQIFMLLAVSRTLVQTFTPTAMQKKRKITKHSARR